MSKKSSTGGGIFEMIKTIVYALLIAAAFRTLLFQPFWIPSGSMKPTLLIGDFLFVNKFAYGYSRYSCPFAICPFTGRIWGTEPERGDVIVFRHPRTGEDYVKRLIGLPGDRIQVRDSVLYINGEPAEQTMIETFTEPYVVQGLQSSASRPRCTNSPVPVGGVCEKDQLLETLPNGVTHPILDSGLTRGDNTPEFLVPEGEYFFMGDNRDNSTDSRFSQMSGGVGMVPFENLIGRADRIVFSAGGDSLLAFWDWRFDRFLKAVE